MAWKARIVGPPLSSPSMGDLWMNTWASDDKLYVSWGDGTGFDPGHPAPANAVPGPPLAVPPTGAPNVSVFGEIFCAQQVCDGIRQYPPARLTGSGLGVVQGNPPEFAGAGNLSYDVPESRPSWPVDQPEPWFFDKPSSLLAIDGRLYWAGHTPEGARTTKGFIATTTITATGVGSWTVTPGTPWTTGSNYRVLMFVNAGKNYALARDHFVYAFGVGTESEWASGQVRLARVPRASVADYTAYEYYTGAKPNPWSTAQADGVALPGLESRTQASAIYHEGLGQYLFLTAEPGALYVAPDPWGPWERAAKLFNAASHGAAHPLWWDGNYIPGLITKGAGPHHVYFTIGGDKDANQRYEFRVGLLEIWQEP